MKLAVFSEYPKRLQTHATNILLSRKRIRLRRQTMRATTMLIAWVVTASGLQTHVIEYSCGLCHCFKGNDSHPVNCSGRSLTEIPENIPKDVTHLDLSRNRLSSIPSGTFNSLTKLSILDLSFNEITRLEDDSLSGLEDSLEILNIDLNRLPYNSSGYARGALNRLRRLTTLSMVTDPCPKHFPCHIISGLSSLKELSIAIPSVGSFHNFSASLVALEALHMNSNCSQSRAISTSDLAALHQLPIRRLSFRKANLRSIDPKALQPFSVTLRKLDISCNAIENITDLLHGLYGLPLQTLLMDKAVAQFRPLELNHNIFSALTSMNLSVLTMSWNNFLEVDLRRGPIEILVPNLTYLRVGYNQVSLKINSTEDLLLALASLVMSVRTLNLDGLFKFYDSYVAALNCNAEDVLFKENNSGRNNDKLRHIPRNQPASDWLRDAKAAYHNYTLTIPPQMTRLYINNVGQLFSDLNCQEFPYRLQDDNNLQRVEVTGSVVPHADCMVRGLGDLSWLEAANIGLMSWGPMFFSSVNTPLLTYVNLHGNKLGEFLLNTTSWTPLNGTLNVTHLDLSENGITGLPVDTFAYSPNLETLNLSWNRIEFLNFTLRSSINMQFLDLSFNYLKSVAPSSLLDFIYIRRNSPNFRINMTHTEMPCYSCLNEDFFVWYLNNPSAVINLTCLDGDDRYQVTPKTLLIIKWQCLYLNILLTGISFIALASVLAILCQSYKWSIRYLYYKARRRTVKFEDRPVLVPVDVYVSYPEAEQSKAEKTVKLLRKMGVRHAVTRAFIAPGKWQYEQIALLVDSCSAIILIVSPTEILYPLFEFEFQMALQKGISRIVLILTTENLNIAKIPRALRKLLNMNNYLTWPSSEESCTSYPDAIQDRRSHRFYVILEAIISNMINQTEAGQDLPLPVEPDDAERENQAHAESLLVSLQWQLGR